MRCRCRAERLVTLLPPGRAAIQIGRNQSATELNLTILPSSGIHDQKAQIRRTINIVIIFTYYHMTEMSSDYCIMQSLHSSALVAALKTCTLSRLLWKLENLP